MNIFSNKFINLFSLFITIIIFLIINFSINNFLKINIENNLNEEISKEEIDEKNTDENSQNNSEGNEEENIEKIYEEENYNWFVEIPSINLKAQIEETVDMEVLNLYVGHFENTDLTLGNIGLAAHNRGYENNYFENLKNINEGDEIIYQYYDFNMEYIVDKIIIIKNTNWDYLESTEENKITLITCTESEPDYRLCVQASEKEKNK